MRWFTVVICVLAIYVPYRLFRSEYKSPVVQGSVEENYVTRAKADTPSCITKNTMFVTDHHGGYYPSGTYDTVSGTPVCGMAVRVKTADGHNYSSVINRFDYLPDMAASGGYVKCFDKARTVECNFISGERGYIRTRVFAQD